MSLPSILAVLDAVVRVAAGHPRVLAWWLAPQARLPGTGYGRWSTSGATPVELAVESVDGNELDCRALERELSGMLPSRTVTVQMLGHGGSRGMMRLLRRDTHRGPRFAELDSTTSAAEVTSGGMP